MVSDVIAKVAVNLLAAECMGLVKPSVRNRQDMVDPLQRRAETE